MRSHHRPQTLIRKFRNKVIKIQKTIRELIILNEMLKKEDKLEISVEFRYGLLEIKAKWFDNVKFLNKMILVYYNDIDKLGYNIECSAWIDNNGYRMWKNIYVDNCSKLRLESILLSAYRIVDMICFEDLQKTKLV